MFTTALAAGLCVCAAAQPEGPWSLKDCTDYALEHNISVRQSGISVQQKEIDLNTAQARRLPGLSLGASENVSFGRGLTADNTYTNSNTSSTSFSLGADLPIFQGFQINNGIKRGRLQLDAAMADLEKAKDDIRVSVAQAYVQILYNEQIAEVARVQVAHDSTLLEQIEVGSGVLDTDKSVGSGEHLLGDGFGKVEAVCVGEVVYYHGHIHAVYYVEIVVLYGVVTETVVVRSNCGDSVEAHFLGVFCHFDGVVGADGAYVRDKGRPALIGFSRRLEQLLALFNRKQKSFTGRTADVEAVNALLHVEFD